MCGKSTTGGSLATTNCLPPILSLESRCLLVAWISMQYSIVLITLVLTQMVHKSVFNVFTVHPLTVQALQSISHISGTWRIFHFYASFLWWISKQNVKHLQNKTEMPGLDTYMQSPACCCDQIFQQDCLRSTKAICFTSPQNDATEQFQVKNSLPWRRTMSEIASLAGPDGTVHQSTPKFRNHWTVTSKFVRMIGI